MQAVYSTPAVPTSIDMLLPTGKAPEDGKPGLLLALPLLLFDGVVPRLAIDGDFAAPPQPAASSARLASPAPSELQRTFTPSKKSEPSKTALNVWRREGGGGDSVGFPRFARAPGASTVVRVVDEKASGFVAECYWPGVSEQATGEIDERIVGGAELPFARILASPTSRAQGGTST